jgi:hypothetical protein
MNTPRPRETPEHTAASRRGFHAPGDHCGAVHGGIGGSCPALLSLVICPPASASGLVTGTLRAAAAPFTYANLTAKTAAKIAAAIDGERSSR